MAPKVRLTLAYAGVRHSFTTRNEYVADRSVLMGLVDGPFSLLDGRWQFVPLGAEAGRPSAPCRVELDMRYAFSNLALGASARCSTASRTRSSIPSCAGPSRSMDRGDDGALEVEIATARARRGAAPHADAAGRRDGRRGGRPKRMGPAGGPAGPGSGAACASPDDLLRDCDASSSTARWRRWEVRRKRYRARRTAVREG